VAITIDATEVLDYLDDLTNGLNDEEIATAVAQEVLPFAQEGLSEFNPHVESNGETASVVAEGERVAFAEFGTGIYASYNLPTNITVAPGSWSQSPHGQGQFIPGKHEYWYYGGRRIEGTQPRNGMYNAAMALDDAIDRVVGEIIDG